MAIENAILSIVSSFAVFGQNRAFDSVTEFDHKRTVIRRRYPRLTLSPAGSLLTFFNDLIRELQRWELLQDLVQFHTNVYGQRLDTVVLLPHELASVSLFK